MKSSLLQLLILITTSLSATEYAPWFGRSFEFEARLKGLYASYNTLQGISNEGFFHHNDDFFLDGSLSTTLFDNYNGEIEFGASDTTLHHFQPHYGSVTGRILLLNDTIGDPISLTTGLTIRGVWSHAVKDFIPQHHGQAEIEMHAAMGKETVCGSTWLYRYWGMLGIGYAMDKGRAPWIRSKLQIDEKVGRFFVGSAFCNGLFGLGSHNLDIWDFYMRDIHWNKIRHYAVDLGVKMSYLAPDYSILTFEYARRVYSKNSPINVNFIELKYVYPFGL